MKLWLTILPLCLTANLVIAAEPAPVAASAPPATGSVMTGGANANPVDTAPAQTRKARRYPRGDLRACLDKKDNKAIIRCANRGRP